MRIGAQIVRTLHENGYKVIIHCHQSEGNARKLCKELNSGRNDSAQIIVADLADNEAIKKLTQKIKSLDSKLSFLLSLSITEKPIIEKNKYQ